MVRPSGRSRHIIGSERINGRTGMMSAQAEAWQIMNLGLGMTYGKGLRPGQFFTELTFAIDEIGDVFAKWNTDGELVHNLLLPELHHRPDFICREAHF